MKLDRPEKGNGFQPSIFQHSDVYVIEDHTIAVGANAVLILSAVVSVFQN